MTSWVDGAGGSAYDADNLPDGGVSRDGEVGRLLIGVVAPTGCATALFDDRGKCCAYQLQYGRGTGRCDERQCDRELRLLGNKVCKSVRLLRIEQRTILIASRERVPEEHHGRKGIAASAARLSCCP